MQYLILYLLSALAHWWCATYLSFHGLSPAFMLVVTVAVSAMAGETASYTYAFFSGLFLDFMGAHLFGGYALTFTLAARGVMFLRKRMDFAGVFSQMFLTAAATLFCILFYGVAGLVFEKAFVWNGWIYFGLMPVLNGVFAPVLFAVLDRCGLQEALDEW